jgi:PAS domain S-box-containing protein
MSPHHADRPEAPQRPSRRTVALAFVLAFAAVVSIFVAYEIIERTWLSDASMPFLHRLHIARGILSSLVAAVLVGWSIIRTSPPLLSSIEQEGAWDDLPADAQDQSAVNYAVWFIRMRWIAILVASTFVISCVRILALLPSVVLWPLLLTLLALAGLNLLYVWIARRKAMGSGFLQVQVYFDLVLLTILLHYSGGVENPLSALMLLHVIIGGIILSRWQCYMVAVAGSLLFAMLALMEASELIEHYTLQVFPHGADEPVRHAAHEPLYVSVRVVLQSLLLFLAAYFVTAVAERLRTHERRLRRMATKAVAESQLLERSLDTTGAALRVLGPDLRPRWYNTRWQKWFGHGRSRPDFMEQLDGERSAARQTYRDGQVRQTEIAHDEGESSEGDLAAGEKRSFQLTTAPLRDSHGNVNGVVELAQDITDRKRTQAQLIRAGQLAAVGELAGQVAHEVNNPIAIIGAKSRLLLSDQRADMSDEVAQEVGKIITLSDRVARIAQGLLSYCRPSGAARVDLDIRDPIRAALAMLDQHAASANVHVVTGLSEQLPRVHANPQELEQVFLNLVLNALDAMPDGGTLTVSATHKLHASGPGVVMVVVGDTGAGVPESARSHVFRPFFTTKKVGRGTGLGLSICQGIVESHGGSIRLTSKVDEGTQVTIELPGASTGRS